MFGTAQMINQRSWTSALPKQCVRYVDDIEKFNAEIYPHNVMVIET